MTPRATYRLQFHKGFTFADAERLVPYFARLGISHVYASPITTARPGSMHGYDVIDPTRVNPELGGEDALRKLVAALRAASLGLIVDIVPNHMAVGAGECLVVRCAATWAGEPLCFLLRHRLERRGRETFLARCCCPCSASRCARRSKRGELTVRETDGEVRYFEHRFRLRAGEDRHLLAASLACSRANTIGLRRGVSQTMRSTGGASSTSTSWRRCAWSMPPAFEDVACADLPALR